MLRILENLFIDLTKLIFAGVVLGAIMRQDIDIDVLLQRGVAAMLLTVATGLTIHYIRNRLKK